MQQPQSIVLSADTPDQDHQPSARYSHKPSIKLDFYYAFGALFSTEATDCLAFLKDEPTKVCYPIGRHLAIKQLGHPDMIFLRQHQQIERITAMQMTPNSRYMCVSSKIRGDNAAYLTFYDFFDPQCKTIKTRLKFEDETGQTTKEVVSLSFTDDSRFVAALSAYPDSTAAVWEWEVKNGFLGSHMMSDHVMRISLHPDDPRRACTSGRQHWKLWQVQENAFKQLNTFVGIDENKTFTDHVWLSPEIIIGVTDYGEIYVLQNYEVKQYVATGFGDYKLYCTKLLVFSHGLFLASQDGHIALYELSQQPPITERMEMQRLPESPLSSNLALSEVDAPFQNYYQFMHCFQIPTRQDVRIVTIAIDPQQKLVGVAYKDNTLALLDMKSVYEDAEAVAIQSGRVNFRQSGRVTPQNIVSNFSSVITHRTGNTDRDSLLRYEILEGGFHSGKIAAIDIATQRPIIASCSRDDLTVKIWNYLTLKCEHTFNLATGSAAQAGKGEYMSPQNNRKSKEGSGRQISSLALHPSGYFMAIAFQDKVKVFHILNESLREYYSLHIKLSPIVKFSNGGHLFTAVDQKYIKVYNAYSMSLLHSLVGPNQNIHDLQFSPDDRLMAICSGNGGYVYVWENRNFDRLHEQNARNCNFRAISFYNKSDIIAGGSDGNGAVLRVLNKGLHQPIGGTGAEVGVSHQHLDQLQIKDSKENTGEEKKADESVHDELVEVEHALSVVGGGRSADGKLTATLILESLHGLKSLVVGTDRGYLRMHELPLENEVPIDYFNAHYGEVGTLKHSPDRRMVISGGDDGAIFLFSVTEYGYRGEILGAQDYIPKKILYQGEDQGKDQTVTEEQSEGSETRRLVEQALERGEERLPFNEAATMIVDMDLGDVLLVEKRDLEEYKNKLETLKHDLEELERKVEEVKQPGAVSSIRQEMMETTNRMNMEMEQYRKRYQELQRQKDQQEKENAQKLQKSETLHKQAKQELDTLYSKRLEVEIDTYRLLQQEYKKMKDEYERKIKNLKLSYKEGVDKLLQESKLQLQKDQEDYDQTKKTSDDLKMIYEEKLSQQEDEHETEIQELKRKHESRIRELVQDIAKIKSSNDGLERAKKQLLEETQTLESENDDLKKEISGHTQKHVEKKDKAQQLETNKKEIAEELNEKEKQIFNLKFQIKNLQKTKQVLSFKTNEMRESLEPKEQHIEKLKKNLLQLEQNFQREIKARNLTQNKIEEKRDNIKQLRAQISSKVAERKDRQKLIYQFTSDIHHYTKSKDQKLYITHMRQLYFQYVEPVRKELLEKLNKDPETMAEMERQMKYMNKSIAGLKGYSVESERKSKVYMHKKTIENTGLIHKLTKLRIENKNLKSENDLLTIKLQKYELNTKENKLAKPLFSSSNRSMSSNKRKEATALPSAFHERPLTAAKGESWCDFLGKGKLYKGTPFDYKKYNFYEKQRISELQAQLEENSQIILYQNLEIKRLKEKLLSILEAREAQYKLQEKEMSLPQVQGTPDGVTMGDDQTIPHH